MAMSGIDKWAYKCQNITISELELISKAIYQDKIAHDINETEGAELDSWVKQEVYD